MMGFGTAIMTCMRKYVTFSGRAPRAEYWWFMLFTSIFSIVLELIEPVIALIVNLGFVLPTLAVGWRRMHDVGKTGAWTFAPLLGLIPLAIALALGVQLITYLGFALIIGLFLYVFYLTIKRGEEGANEFGDDPYGIGSHDPSVFD